MKRIVKGLAAILVSTSVLWAPQAQSALIFLGGYNGGPNNYIGTYNPNTNDTAIYANSSAGSLPAVGSPFADIWVFNVSPAGLASINANFLPGDPDPLSITGFQVNLYQASGACGAIGTACGGFALGALVATGTPATNSSNIGFTGPLSGLYAFRVTGTVATSPTLYSGQLVTAPVSIPEPATLALLGLGLAAVGLARRRQA